MISRKQSNQFSENSESPQKMTAEYWDKMGKINLLTGMTGAQQLRWEARQAQKNREAEESHARRVAWGDNGGSSPEEDMGDQITLGDVTHVYETAARQEKAGISKTGAMLAGLAAAGMLGTGAAGVAGTAGVAYLLNRSGKTEEVQQEPQRNLKSYKFRLIKDKP